MPGPVASSFSSQQIAEEAAAPIRWKLFDAVWYRRRYSDVLSDQERDADDQTLQALWRQEGVKNGRSPNSFFDERWYLRHNGDVLRGIQFKGIFESGYQHYSDIGYRSCSPHWLFDQEEYLRQNRDISLRHIYNVGFKNGYDYFLKVGDLERDDPHLFFNQKLFLHECLKDGIEFDFTRGGFDQYLSLEISNMGKVRTSWYFDPKWYLEHYPNVISTIESGQYSTPLHHYLDNDHAQDFDPNPFFSEKYYCDRYPDVREAIEKGIFRNGYAHFIASGVYEHRQPHEHVDLIQFSNNYDINRLCKQASVKDVFALWVKSQEEGMPTAPDNADYESYQRLAIGHIEAALPSVYRSPLSFSRNESVTISVILLSEGDYASVIASLLSLHQQQINLCEIILVSSGSQKEKSLVQQLTRGITLIYPSDLLSESALLEAGLKSAHADNIVVVRSGLQLIPGSLAAIGKALESGNIDGGTGQTVGADGYVREAGCQLWRNGTIVVKGAGQLVSSDENGAECELEATRSAFFFGKRKPLLKGISLIHQCGLEAGFAPLALSLRGQGLKLRYVPDIIVRDISTKLVSMKDVKRQTRMMRRCFAHVLMRHSLPGGENNSAKAGVPTVVMVFSHLPRRCEGGSSRRIFQQIDEFLRLGWQVTVAGVKETVDDALIVPLDYPRDVKCIREIGDIASFVREQCQSLHLLWINGTNTLSIFSPFLYGNNASISVNNIVLDVVKQDGSGLHAMEAHLRRLVGATDDRERLMREAADELSAAWMCQCILAGDERECQLIRRLGFGNVCLLPFVAVPSVEKGREQEFYRRHGLLFPLCISHSGDAAHDGFDWFCLHVMPHVKALLGDDIPIWVGGYHDPSVDLGFYERFVALEGLVQPVNDHELMARCRVLVAPARLLASKPTEVIDGAAHGIPSVMSAALIESLQWKDRLEGLNGGFNDPMRFAQAVVDLYRNEKMWSVVQRNAQQQVMRDNRLECFQKAFRRVLELALNRNPIAQDAIAPEFVPMKKRFEPSPLRLRPDPSSTKEAQEISALEEDAEADDDKLEAPLQTRLGVKLSQ